MYRRKEWRVRKARKVQRSELATDSTYLLHSLEVGDCVFSTAALPIIRFIISYEPKPVCGSRLISLVPFARAKMEMFIMSTC